jgi:hypothetical protein
VLKKLLIFYFFIGSAFQLSAQQLDSLLNEQATKYPQEKVYLQFDRPYYNAGQTIWFKAYLSSGNLPSTISKTLYADLLDEKGKVLQRKIMPVIQSGAASGFDLPDSIQHTTLYVRAYTAWMLNFDSSLFYLKAIPLITPDNKIKKVPATVLYSLHFFPEGGDLVNNVNARVAFKANDQKGDPFDVSGSIVDNTGNKIASFVSVHDGMGAFTFTPLPGKKYSAIWKDKRGAEHETPLPEAKTQGIALTVYNTADEVVYTLSRPDSVTDAFTSFYVIAQMQQQLVYSAKVYLTDKTAARAPIETDSLPDGIMQLTVFNADQLPVAERIVFINHGNYYFNTDLHAEIKDLGARGRNVLQIDVGGDLKTNLSIAVTDADLDPSSKNEENIFSSLLLTSDIKGYVYNPAYYFSNDDDSLKQQLDLVMMTNGWRRFKWQDLLTGNWPAIKYQPENYIAVKGKAYGLSRMQLTGRELIFFIKTKNVASDGYIVPVTKEGDFGLPDLSFYDSARFFYQFNNDKDKTLTSNASFSFFYPFALSPAPGNFLANLYNLNLPDSNTIKKSWLQIQLSNRPQKKVIVLDSITVVSRVKTPEEKMDDEYASGFFKGSDAHTFILSNDITSAGYANVLTYLQGKVAGLSIEVDGGGNATATWRGSKTAFYRDEFNIDINTLLNMPISDIAMIKVFEPPFMGGFGPNGGGEGGAIAVYTKRGSENSSVKGLDFSTVPGYSAIKEFYAPDYSQVNDLSKPDYRTTLYWNPSLLMNDKIRRITIPFYNNDNCTKIKVVIEGMNEAGQLTNVEKIFE